MRFYLDDGTCVQVRESLAEAKVVAREDDQIVSITVGHKTFQYLVFPRGVDLPKVDYRVEA